MALNPKEQPCQPDCQFRTATCHATCPDYAKFYTERSSNYKFYNDDYSVTKVRAIRRKLNLQKRGRG